MAEGAAASGDDDVGVALVLEEGRQSLGSHVALTRKAQSSESGPNWARTYLPRAMISAGPSAVIFAAKSFATPVTLMAARMALTTSGVTSLVWLLKDMVLWKPLAP